MLGAIAFDLSEKGVIEKLTENQFKDKMNAIYKEAEEQVKPMIDEANKKSNEEVTQEPKIIMP